jgi:tetratricopeptide (TPR) repeat protein
MASSRLLCCALFAVAALPLGAARAQEGPPSDTRPWARGIRADEQSRALALFREGNVFFEQSRYSQALERYRAAIVHWDHPAIRFNMAVCLVNLDSPLEARDALERALVYGVDAFDTPDLYAQAITYRKLLDGQLAVLTLACAEPGARVTLDGGEVLRAPGKTRHVLRPGPHQVIASKEGFLPTTRTVTLLSGREHREQLTLVTIASATRYEHRFPQWKPWLVFSAGATVALVGVALELAAKADYDNYAREFGLMFPNGRDRDMVPASLADVQTRAAAENAAAIASFAVGGVGLAAGVVLLVLNRARPVLRRNVARARVAPAAAGIAVVW